MEELIEHICEYVKKPYTDYAVMINGEWGSGKTYFWNHKLRKRLEALKIGGKNYQTIYMSLYGINSLEEISKKIFIETSPTFHKTLKKVVSEKEGNNISEYVKTGIDMANFFHQSGQVEKLDFSKNFTVENKILCFDDLERANVDVIDILGYINNFVEHDGIKTILICNEKELAIKYKYKNIELKTLIASYLLAQEKKLGKEEKPLLVQIENKISEIFVKSNDYERIKEKLIGETFEYIPEYPYILSGMIMKYTYHEKLCEFLKKNTSIMIAIFKRTNTRNLRILKHALNDYERIFEETLQAFPEVPVEILKTMLQFTLAVSFELKTGSIMKEKLEKIQNNQEYMFLTYTSSLLKDTYFYQDFEDTYFSNTVSTYHFFKFIEVYVRSRYFDEKKLNQEVKEAIEQLSEKKEEEKLKYGKLLSGEYLRGSNQDFTLLISQVDQEIQEGSVSFYDYVPLFMVYEYFVDQKLLDKTKEELKKLFILGMQKSSKFCLKNLEDIHFSSDTYESVDLMEMVKKEKEISKKIYQQLLKEKANEVFSLLETDILAFYQKMTKEYQNIAIFSCYPVETLYEKLCLVSNYDLNNILRLIESRYQENKALLKEEKKNLLALSDVIKNHLLKEKRTLQEVLLLKISQKIDEMF